MSSVFNLPDLGEGLQQAEIVAWHVGVGDHVVTDQPLVSVETDKALVEVPSPHSGHIAALHGKPGDILAVGAPLVEFTDAQPKDPGAIVGTIEQTDEPSGASAHAAPPARHAAEQLKISPAVRHLAATLGVDLAQVTATGVSDTITRADVEAAARSEHGSIETRMTGVRRTMLERMARAGREVVPATIMDEADIEAWAAGTDLTLRLIRALVAGCRAAPMLNAWFDAPTGRLQQHANVDLGLAMETDDGLFTPVLHDVARRTAEDLRADIETTKAALARRTLPYARLTGQTITLSNFGMFGGRYAELVVVPPQVAILGAGRAMSRPVVSDGRIVAHRLLPLSLTFDHRVATGVEASRFLTSVAEDLALAS